MSAEVQLHQDVYVHYCQIYVESRNARLGDSMSGSFRGQVNGLCGAVVPGTLFLKTGTHTGRVGFTVELHSDEPPLDEGWEEAVEVSFTTDNTGLGLAGWDGEGWYPLDLPDGDYRVRYCGRGMAAGRENDDPADGAPPWDSYLLQFWPAPPAADRVLRETAEGAYWHGYARSLPPAPKPAEPAKTARQERLKR